MKKFSKKIDVLFWFIVALIPLIAFVVMGWNNGGPVSFATVASTFRYNFIADIFNEVFKDNLLFPVALVDFMSYFCACEVVHVFVDFIVFIPRLAHDLLGGLYGKKDF